VLDAIFDGLRAEGHGRDQVQLWAVGWHAEELDGFVGDSTEPCFDYLPADLAAWGIILDDVWVIDADGMAVRWGNLATTSLTDAATRAALDAYVRSRLW
jgi:alkaline phosphatase